MEKKAIQKAVDYIADRLDNNTWAQGDFLPSLSNLALAAGVSRGTMAKAITELKKAGRLSVRQGSRIYAGSRPADQSTILNPNAWENKRKLFEQDILKGIFPIKDPLPTISELQARYGLSYRSMMKILQSLAAERTIVAHKKKFFLYHPGQPSRRGVFCLLWEGLSYGSKPRPHREGRIIEAFQRGCSLIESTGLFLGFDIRDPKLRDTIRRGINNHPAILGYIIRPLSPITVDRKSRYIELLLELARDKKPVAFMDEFGDFSLPEPLASNKLFKIFGIGGFAAGKSVARELLRLGHSRIAFISSFSNEEWSIKRFLGLQSEYVRVGGKNAVMPFLMETPQSLITALLAPRKLTSEQSARLGMGQEDSREDPEKLLEHRFPSLKKIVSENSETINHLRGYMKNAATIPPESMFGPTLERMIDHAVIYMGKKLEQIFLTTLFEKALADRSCTAWVGANDDIAVYAIQYLQKENRRIPGDISIVGFDADPPGFEFQLTSFDFDFYNMLQQMIAFVAHPMALSRITVKQYVEMPGLMLWRGSLGKPKA